MVFNDLLFQSYDSPGTVHPGPYCSPKQLIKYISDRLGYAFGCNTNTNDIGYLCAIPNRNFSSMGVITPPIGNLYPFL